MVLDRMNRIYRMRSCAVNLLVCVMHIAKAVYGIWVGEESVNFCEIVHLD